MSLSAPDVIQALDSVEAAHSRLVLLVGPAGSGKTRLFQEISKEAGYPIFKLSGPLSEFLQELAPNKRPDHIWAHLADSLAENGKGPVLVDNIEVLFLPELQQDPLRLLQDLARNRSLVVAWPGHLDRDGALVYAEPGHPEHKLYRRPEALCLRMPGTL